MEKRRKSNRNSKSSVFKNSPKSRNKSPEESSDDSPKRPTSAESDNAKGPAEDNFARAMIGLILGAALMNARQDGSPKQESGASPEHSASESESSEQEAKTRTLMADSNTKNQDAPKVSVSKSQQDDSYCQDIVTQLQECSRKQIGEIRQSREEAKQNMEFAVREMKESVDEFKNELKNVFEKVLQARQT